ncbi:MAG: hypothetical protein ABIO24_13555 [Saprospiraceae bacterium]
MTFDPSNPIVQLCAQGMALEAEGKIPEAHQLFQQAWEAATNDFEAFTAAHFLARNQPDAPSNLHWNLEALHRAQAIPDESVQSYLPSLYLNVGKSHEQMDDLEQAVGYYRQAAEHSHLLPIGPYGDMIKSGISSALARTSSQNFNPPILTDLVNAWCERRDLKPLSFVLPAYIGNLGAKHDLAKLSSALSYLSATRCLAREEQEKVEGVIAGLAIISH